MVELAWGLRMSNSYFLWVITCQGSGRGKAPKKLRGGDVGEGNSVSLVSSAGGLNSRVGGMLYDPLWVELYSGGLHLRLSDRRSATMDRPTHKCPVYYGFLEDETESST